MIKRARTRSGRGMAVVYSVISISALMMFVSLAVDYGRVQVVKIELSRAADASACYAAAGISSGITSTQNNAIAAAADNIADGSSVSISSSDVEFGTWDASAKTFTVLTGSARTSANAIRVTVRRTAANGNAVPLMFARVLGRSSCDVTAVSIARATTTGPTGFGGLNGITMKNNNFIGSYNSASNSTPTHGNSQSNGRMRTNGAISGGNNNTIYGIVDLGPSGSISGVTVSGSQSSSSTAIATPADATWSPDTNPGGIAQNYTVGSNTTLAGGTYWFTSLTLSADLSFSSSATVYVNGNVTLGNSVSLTAYQSSPKNLQIYQIGSRTFGSSSDNNVTITAQVYGPHSDFASKNNLTFRGSATFDTIDVKNNADFYYDDAMGSAAGYTSLTTVR